MMSLALVVGAAGTVLGIELVRQNTEIQDRLKEWAAKIKELDLIPSFIGTIVPGDGEIAIGQTRKLRGLEGIAADYDVDTAAATQGTPNPVLKTVAWTTLCIGAGVYIGQQKYGQYAYHLACRTTESVLNAAGNGVNRVYTYCVLKSPTFRWASIKIQAYAILASQKAQDFWEMLSKMAQENAVLSFLKKYWPGKNIDDDKSDDDSDMIDTRR